MLPPLLQISSTVSNLPSWGALPSWLVILAIVSGPLLGYFGARYTATAPLQASLNDAFKVQLQAWQDERAQHIAHCLELEQTAEKLKLALMEKDGEIRNLKAIRDGLGRVIVKQENEDVVIQDQQR